MAASEIEKLERRYAENPHGLTFAPLAEVHRKSGDLVRALELLHAGLELHPNYIPASIVLGRCHQDLGDLPAAEAAFAHVLRLDDENVIALKSLADIDEKQGRFDEAEGWVRRLVAVDRSNEDAREQLRRIEAARETASSLAEPAGQPEPLPFIPGTEPAASVTSVAEEAVPDEREAADLTPIDLEPLALTEQTAEPAAEVASAARDSAEPPASEELPSLLEAESSPDRPDQEEAAVVPMAGLVSGEFEPPQESEGIGVELSEDMVLESSDMSEFRVPDASEDFKSLAASMSPRRESAPAQPADPAWPPAARPSSEPEFVVTETMAEVLLGQGHADDALRIYRELARRRGGDAHLESRIEEVSAQVARLAAGTSYLARETNGQSVASFFRTMLAARPPADLGSENSRQPPPVDEGGAPTRPAQDSLSLSSVFGEDSLPIPPAVPAADQRTEGGVSFDAFFSSPGAESSPAKSRSSDPRNDDLDQFHSWLQNLKR